MPFHPARKDLDRIRRTELGLREKIFPVVVKVRFEARPRRWFASELVVGEPSKLAVDYRQAVNNAGGRGATTGQGGGPPSQQQGPASVVKNQDHQQGGVPTTTAPDRKNFPGVSDDRRTDIRVGVAAPINKGHQASSVKGSSSSLSSLEAVSVTQLGQIPSVSTHQNLNNNGGGTAPAPTQLLSAPARRTAFDSSNPGFAETLARFSTLEKRNQACQEMMGGRAMIGCLVTAKYLRLIEEHRKTVNRVKHPCVDLRYVIGAANLTSHLRDTVLDANQTFGDFVFLEDTRENMNSGKSPDWIDYVAENFLADAGEEENGLYRWIGKLDLDAFVDSQKLVIELSKLPRRRVFYGGDCNHVLSHARTLALRYTTLARFPAGWFCGELYVISRDVVHAMRKGKLWAVEKERNGVEDCVRDRSKMVRFNGGRPLNPGWVLGQRLQAV